MTALSSYNTTHWSDGVLIAGTDVTIESTAAASATTDSVTLQSLTAASGSNSATASAGNTASLQVQPDASGNATLNLSAYFTPSNDGQDIPWSISGATASPSSGDFSAGSPTITLSGLTGGLSFTISAGTTTTGIGTIQVNVVGSLQSATVTQPETSLSQTATVQGGSMGGSADLYIPETGSNTADVNLSTQWTSASDAVRYVVSYDAGGSPTSGTIASGGSSNVVLNPTAQTATGQNMDFTVTFSLVTSSGSSDGSGATCTIHIHLYTVAIEFDNTPATNDDAVMLSTPSYGADIPANTPLLDGDVRIIGDPLPNDMPVTLDNPDAGLEFCAPDSPSTAPAAQTLPLTLSANGVPARFKVMGVSASFWLFAAKVRVIANIGGNAGGRVLGIGGVTVFWFKDAQISVTATGSYGVTDGVTQSTLGVDRSVDVNADIVGIDAQAKLQPDGLDDTIDQIKWLRVGIVQNVSSDSRSLTYDDPIVNTNPHHGVGTVYGRIVFDASVSGTRNDTGDATPTMPATTPLYATPEADDGSIDGHRMNGFSVVLPNDTLGSSIDDPNQAGRRTYQLDGVADANGNVLGSALYGLGRIYMADTFTDYCVICEQSPGNRSSYRVIAPLQQTGWKIAVNALKGNGGIWAVTGGKAVPDSDSNGGSPVSVNPVLSGTSINAALAENWRDPSAQESDDEVSLNF